ncbi:MAG: type II toxin-antitoxin system PemK/MazF family toxin [Acidobacteriia bacterium]|nr:type II toxin-antitoxin system PemK/MazF family toxin [Terriglobia bacterium]
MTGPACSRGDIWMVDLNPGRGSEQTGMRPALIVQNDVGNQYASTTIVAAITTTIRKYPVTVVLDRNEGGLKQPSMVNLAQILTLDKTRLKKKLGVLSQARIAEVNSALHISLGLSA